MNIDAARAQVLQIKSLSEFGREWILKMTVALAKLPWIKAISLGGSHAQGMAVKNSDIDLVLQYSKHSPHSLGQLINVAKQLASRVLVTKSRENGSIKRIIELKTEGVICDWIYLNLDEMQRIVTKAKKGFYYWDLNAAGMGFNGFSNVQYLSWISHNIVLYDPSKICTRLKEELQLYPKALQKAVVQKDLGNIAAVLLPLENENCNYTIMGYIVRIITALTHVLFALNLAYYYMDRKALQTIKSFSLKPKNYIQRVEKFLAHSGKGLALKHSIRKLEALVQEVRALAKVYQNI